MARKVWEKTCIDRYVDQLCKDWDKPIKAVNSRNYLEYKKIHACPNDCVLYTNDFATLKVCPTCAFSRFKKKTDGSSGEEEIEGPPAKVLWYLPIIHRFKRLFAIKKDAKNLTWHENGRKCDNFLRHPADSPQWKRIDETFPKFGVESRNLRIGLATDGMNPYGNLSSKHSSWPVLLVIYNLPPRLCMKRKYIIQLTWNCINMPYHHIKIFHKISNMAIGRVFEGGSTIHGVPLQPDWTRVVVDQVQDAAALVHLPNTEVQLVGQATGTLLAWPKRLVMPLSARAKVMREPHVDDANIAEAEGDPISKLLIILPRLKKKPIQLQWDIRVFGVDSSDVPLYISLPDALEIVGGNSMLNISIIQLWAMYMDKLSVEQAQAEVYGFIEPQSIQKSGNTQVQIQQYMQTWMSDSRRDIYMAPYIDGLVF
uniref:Uncharacterized protein n=1 Tax=Cajanus cajan TaxID=3821 RepID=A0A151SWY6_CAJCA|nr:hypothetical protein KK1_014721 [Cajanus cajan]